jgi:hypothetical protein
LEQANPANGHFVQMRYYRSLNHPLVADNSVSLILMKLEGRRAPYSCLQVKL